MAKTPKTDLDRSLDSAGVGEETTETVTKKEKFVPQYRAYADSRIPVSKSHGTLWKSRRDGGKKKQEKYARAWDQANEYYLNDQIEHRSDTAGGKTHGARRQRGFLSEDFLETENLVFANTTTMLPMLYARNPSVEVTSRSGEAGTAFATVCEDLVNELVTMLEAPGINLKPYVRRATLNGLLSNRGIIALDWIPRLASNEETLAQIQQLAKDLEGAKDLQEIEEIEGKLQAMEEVVDLLLPEGPWVRNVTPKMHLIDPCSDRADGTDAAWQMEGQYISTSYLNARYRTKDEASGEWKSVYKPSVVIGVSGGNVQKEVDDFKLFETDVEKASAYGYDSDAAFDKAKLTLCWYIWDKTTRRVYLYADNDWSWPIWVWDDPLRLLRFFPYFILPFHEAPTGTYALGEVTYYLDQQDSVNMINDMEYRARRSVRNNWYFDINKIKLEDVMAVLNNDEVTARGVDVPEGQTLEDCIKSFAPNYANFPELFRKDGKYAAIDRIASVSKVMRGEEFKTNTTNDAISQYQASSEVRVDEKTDAIETFVGDICWNLLQLCATKMRPEMVMEILGQEKAAAWQTVTDPKQLRTLLNVRVIGGSTAKPDSKAKKQEALQVGQILGQFASGSPFVVVIMMRLFQEAFTDISMTDQDWQMLIQSVMQKIQAESQPSSSTEQPPNPNDASAQPNSETTTQAGNSKQSAEQVAQRVQALTPQQKQMVQQAIDQGVSPAQALADAEQQGAAQSVH